MYEGELYHSGVMGMHWGQRRYQNEDGSYKPGAEGRYYTPKQQKKEFKNFQRSQSHGYRSHYDRMNDYSKKSKMIQERSKELTDLADKARDLDMEYDNYVRDNDLVRNKANDIAYNMAKKDPSWDKEDPYVEYKNNDQLVEWYKYNEDCFDKAADQIFKNDSKFKQLKKSRDQSISDYKSKCKEITEQIVGEYGDTKVSGLADVKNLKYKEMVYYALSKPHTMWMFTTEDELGRT